MSDYTPPAVVTPTPGGAAGDGSLGGALTGDAAASVPWRIRNLSTTELSTLTVPNGFIIYEVGASVGILFRVSEGIIEAVSLSSDVVTGFTQLWLGFDTTNDLTFGKGANCRFTGADGLLGEYAGISTAGLGFSPIYGAGLRVALGTSSAAVASYTPGATGSFRIVWRLAAKAATTPTLTLTYTDPDAGAQTITLYSTAMPANGVASGVYPLVSGASAITVSGSALVAGDIIATVEIIQSQ